MVRKPLNWKNDTTEATDKGAITSESMVTNDPSKRPLAPNTKNMEGSKDDSNTQNVPVDDAVEKSIDHPENKDNDSETEVDTVASTEGNGNTLNAKLSLSHNFPFDMVDTTDEKSVTYSIPQAEHHHNNKGYTGHVLKERFSTNTSITGNPNNGRNPDVKSHTTKDSAETTKDDTGNASNKGPDSVKALYNMECNKDSKIDDSETLNYPAAMVPAITEDDKDELAASNFARPANQPNGRKFVEANDSKEATNDNCDNIRFEQNCEELLVPELEIRFSIDDLRIGYDKRKDDIYNFDELTKIVFRIAIFPQGKGLQSICQWEQELQSEYETHKLASGDSSRDDHDDDNDKEIYGTITLVVGKRENEASNVINAYLNGVERRVSVDTGAAASIIHHSLDPRKDRKFKILDIQRYCFPNWYDINWREVEPDVTPITENYSQYSETYWSSEDEDESEEITSNRDEE